jgi:hypothetical protein
MTKRATKIIYPPDAYPEVKQLNNMWVCIGNKRYPDYGTIAHQRGDSMKKWIENTSITWKDARKLGFRCVKVNVSFEIV